MTTPRFTPIARLGRQVAAVSFVGIALGLFANFLSPRGLELGKDYFPPAPVPAIPPSAAAGVPPVPVHEFSSVATGDLEEMLGDARFVTRRFLLIDARSDAHYREGHIQGALQFDHFQAQQYLGTVIPACQAAERIVIYCTGGACEDSIFAARMLRDFGIPAERFAIYSGGIAAWQEAGRPLSQSAP